MKNQSLLRHTLLTCAMMAFSILAATAQENKPKVSEAEAKAGTPLPYSDALTMSSAMRGYVSVAISKGLMQADGAFRPQGAFNRADLARATAVIQRRAIASE